MHQLQQAARIGRCHGLRACGQQIIHFAAAELIGCIGLQQIEDACRTAAERGLGNLSDLKIRDFG